jgi:tRNA(Ile)-lysidine synthase
VAGLVASVAAIRTAVRRSVTGHPSVLVACSGGADSLALAAATAFMAPRLGLRAGLVTVDHQLQPGSAERAAAVAEWAGQSGFDPIDVCTVDATVDGDGPEAAARRARYAALLDAARRHAAAAVLLGHTRDDQAETVLLALARGAGPRGLAGMAERRDVDGVILLRPLLDVTRAQTADACAALGLKPWTDPHNTDPAYARARVRAVALPTLVDVLGPDVVDNLARTARLLGTDAAYLDALAASALDDARAADGALHVATLRDLPAALRTRVLHAWARECGAPAASLSYIHIDALEALVTAWRGQGPVHLPGGIQITRYQGSGGQAALGKVK